MRKTFALAAFFGALALSTAAFAETPTPPTTNPGKGDGSNASPCGAVHGAFADVNGSFGSRLGGMGGTPGYHDGATGQEAGATGYNNSHTGCQPNNPS